MMIGSLPTAAVARMRAQRDAVGFEVVGGHDGRRGGTVDHARRVAGVVHVVDGVDVRIPVQTDLVEGAVLTVDRHRSHRRECRRECGQFVGRGAGSRVLILFEHHRPVRIGDRYQGAIESPFGGGGGGTLLALCRIGVDVGAAEAFQAGDQVG